MIVRNNNPRKQGDAGIALAIAWFATNSYTVCVPLTDSQSYDLVVDNCEGLQRVFVRTSTQDKGGGNFEVGLRTQGGNKSQFKIKHFDKNNSDLVFIACSNGHQYLIPTCDINCISSITVGKKYAQYRVQ